MSKALKLCVPPLIPAVCRRVLGRRDPPNGFLGSYDTWEDARRASTGYDSPAILERMLAAALRVKHGAAAYERDGVVFAEVQYSWPTLAGLMWAAAETGGDLKVLDFGGALGTTYFQNRRFLEGLKRVSWNVVEQPHVAAAGRQHIEDETLHFFDDIAAGCRERVPDLAIFSSVLQYLEHPRAILDQCLGLGIPRLLIDLTPFSDAAEDRICVQRVPPTIYDASYPAWVFSLARFRQFVTAHEVLADFANAPYGQVTGGVFRGFILRAHPPAGACR